MIKTDAFDFLLRPKSNREFDSICRDLPNSNLDKTISILRCMPNHDIFAFRYYAEQGGRTNAAMWAHAEIQRREFLLNQTAIFISVFSFSISLIALFS